MDSIIDIAAMSTRVELAHMKAYMAALIGSAATAEKSVAITVNNIYLFSSRIIRSYSFNRLLLNGTQLDAEGDDVVQSLIARYDINCVEIVEGSDIGTLRATIRREGFRFAGVHGIFHGRLDCIAHGCGEVNIDLVDEGNIEQFLDIYGKFHNKLIKFVGQGWLANNRWALYIAHFDGYPAGIAISFFMEDVVYLSEAYVLSQWRNRGVHQALIRRRCADAENGGQKVVLAHAKCLSNSHSNLVNSGLRLITVKSVWFRELA